MIKIPEWYKEKITEEQYMWYILQGYEIAVDHTYVMFLADDKLHREDGPAVIYRDGETQWFINGNRHRLDGGPVIEKPNGFKSWWVNGKRHRIDGPAVIYGSGTPQKFWYINDTMYTEADFNEKIKQLV